jgi:C4-dicarboxylate-specific signal transduction histidine kinase
LSDAKALQAELIQSEKLAGIGTLAAGIAHEISSPLFGILGLAEAIPDENDRVKVDTYAKEIAEYSHNIRDIVVDLTSYSRTSSDAEIEDIDLGAVIGEAVTMIERGLDTNGISMSVECAEGLKMGARPTEIRQIFVNLIKNAIESVRDEHREDGGAVRVAAGRHLDGLWVVVEDNGVGIPEDVRKQVFDPFYTTKPPGKGTGLGLNIVYRIVTKYRGTIAIEEGEAGGSLFRLGFSDEV